MGYYTKYDLDVQSPGKPFSESDYAKLRETPYHYGTIADLIDHGTHNKWYDHEDDMREISKTFPDFLFILEGLGEEAGDHWRKYFKDGKCQRTKAEVRFEAYDPSKLW